MALPLSMREKMVRVLTKPIEESHHEPEQVAQALFEAIERHEQDKHRVRVDEKGIYRKSVHATISQIASGMFAMSLEERRRLLPTSPPVDVEVLLEKCTEVVHKNKRIWTTVTNHHASLKGADGEWPEVIASHEGSLVSYADAATFMGEKRWVQRGHRWIVDILHQFWFGKLALSSWRRLRMKQRGRTAGADVSVSRAIDEEIAGLASPLLSADTERIRLLDVGSCFNPFAAYPSLEVTAVDLEPRHHSVYAADFLSVDVTEEGVTQVQTQGRVVGVDAEEQEGEKQHPPRHRGCRLTALLRYSYHGVVMSLVLSYLPSAREREDMVAKAREVLVHGRPEQPHAGGVLMIAEKASVFPSSGTLYSRFVATWKRALGRLGFSVVRYEVVLCDDKRMHLMACRVANFEDATATLKEVGHLFIKADFVREEEMKRALCEVEVVRKRRGVGL